MGEPFGTVPTQLARPELFFLLSAHLKFAFTAWPSLNESPSLGRVSVAVGLSASTLNAISFVASTFPTLSVAWYWRKWLPVVKPEIGPRSEERRVGKEC